MNVPLLSDLRFQLSRRASPNESPRRFIFNYTIPSFWNRVPTSESKSTLGSKIQIEVIELR
ncbi:hypothetical protein OAG82_02405, partial [Rubripirellula sp.]|nr:hypothetical protein [Rubripirellula sp.]